MQSDAPAIGGHGHGHDHGAHDHAHDHSHDNSHAHAHALDHAGHRPAAPRPVRSLLALSGLQRLALAAPAIAALWLLTAWAMGGSTP
jgi:ABC-type Zn2+ transport system substrate-binding protein/surface adhesin